MADERERPTVHEYREMQISLLKGISTNSERQGRDLEALATDLRDVRERTVRLETADVAGQMAGLRADLRTYEERFRRATEAIEGRVGKLENDHSTLSERVSGIKGLIVWIGGVVGTVLAVGLGLVLYGGGK